MKQVILIVLISAAIGMPIAADAAYVNNGYLYTDHNAGAINYYNHPSYAKGFGRHSNYRYSYTYPQYYPQYYPEYYPQYYPVYYTQPAPPAPAPRPLCHDYNRNLGPYYESPERIPSCSDRTLDWHNTANLPNQFLSEMYGTRYY